MIYITQNSTNTFVLQLNDSVTLSNPFFIFDFIDVYQKRVTFSIPNISTTTAYNKFIYTDGSDNQLQASGNVNIYESAVDASAINIGTMTLLRSDMYKYIIPLAEEEVVDVSIMQAYEYTYNPQWLTGEIPQQGVPASKVTTDSNHRFVTDTILSQQGTYATNSSVNLAFYSNASLGLAGVVDFTPYATNSSVNLAFYSNASLGLAGVVDFTPYATNASVNLAFYSNASLGNISQLSYVLNTSVGILTTQLNKTDTSLYNTKILVSAINASMGSGLGTYATNTSVGLAFTSNTSLGNISQLTYAHNASINWIDASVKAAFTKNNTQDASLNDTWLLSNYVNTSEYYDGSINDIRTTYLKKSVPYLSLYDTSTKTAGAARPRAIMWNHEGGKNKIIHKAGDSSWGYTVEGDYLMIFSAIGVATTPADHMMFWWTKNGSTNPIPFSNSKCEFVTNNNEKIITVSFITDASVGDYHELMWYASDPGDALVPTDASTVPFVYPASPSIILTLNLINEY